MKLSNVIKLTAVATLIALAVIAIRREHKHPMTLVTKVTEIVVMTKAHAEDIRVEPVAPERKPGVVDRLKQKLHIPPTEPTHTTKAIDGSGAKWTFPYSCKTVKWYAAHFSKEQLESMRKLAGKRPPTPAEEVQIGECIAGRFQ
jgi:hypothetical protein